MENDLFKATVNKYIGNEMVATATGTFLEIIESLNITGVEKDTYFKLARYDAITYDFVEDVHFGCSCKRRGGLKITEGIYCNAYLNELFNTYFKGEYHTKSFDTLVRVWIKYQEATYVDQRYKENFAKGSHSFFEREPWQKVTDLNELKNISGLYALILDEYAKCYIGQSVDIRKRILAHWRVNRFTTKGIDLFRAKDTTRIYAIPLSEKEMDENEYNYVKAIPRMFRLNFLQGGTIAFHEAQNTSLLFNETFQDRHDYYKLLAIMEKMNANYFEEKIT